MPIHEEVSSEDETYSPQPKQVSMGRDDNDDHDDVNLIDQTGKLMLEHHLHPCTLPFSVQNKLLFYLSQDDINTLFCDRNKTKDGWEAGPQFTLTDHDRTLIKILLRLPVSKASEGAICHEHDLCESEFLKQVERMNKDGEAFAFITDEKEFIHKFKTNLRTCRLNENVINAVTKPVSRKKLKVKKHRGRGRGKKKQADTVMENVTERGRVMEMDEAMMENDDDFKENTPVLAAIRKTGGGPTATLRKSFRPMFND